MLTMHLFAGAGGGLLADLILGHEPIVAVEIDRYCCNVLRKRAEEGWFPNLHVWEGDIKLFDPSPYKGRVDCIHAGVPCQPWSVAGARRGEDDERNLWPATLDIIGEVRPRYVFMENVAGFPAWNGGRYVAWVIGRLAELGYDARWCVLSAAAVGTPHIRARWWCLAELADDDGERVRDVHRGCCGQEGEGQAEPEHDGEARDVAHSDRKRQLQQEGREPDERGRAGNGCQEVADAMRLNAQGEQREFADKEGREKQGEGQAGPRGHGIGWWSVESCVGRVVDGLANRVHRIKALGNGQVPLQAAVAWMMLGGPVGGQRWMLDLKSS